MADDGGTGTFGLDESLADYPLPSLEHTLDVYLESAKPFLNPEELKETEGCVADFKANEGPKLQQVLEDRAKQHRNWVSAKGVIEGQQEGSATVFFLYSLNLD